MIATIQGLGLISPWGETYKEFSSNYKDMHSPLVDIQSVDRFEAFDNIGASKISPIRDFNAKNYFSSKNMRKYNVQSRLGIACSKLALKSVDLSVNKNMDVAEMGAVYANLTHSTETANFLKSMVNEGPENASPRNFPLSTPNAMACHVSTELGVTGPTINLCSRFSSGFGVIYNGVNLLRAGHTDYCLTTSVDFQTQVILELYSRFGTYKSKKEDDGCYPADMAGALLLSNKDAESSGYGKIISMVHEGSTSPNYRFPDDWKVHASVLRKAIGDRKVHKYLSASNGISQLEVLEQKALEAVFPSGQEAPEVVKLKEAVGEAGTMPLFQVIAACSEPKGHLSLISVVGTGGIHGAVLIESTGRWAEMEGDLKMESKQGDHVQTTLAI